MEITAEEWRKAFRAIDKNPTARARAISSFGLDRRSIILEVGCGEGINLRAFRELGYRRVFGLDLSAELLPQDGIVPCLCADARRMAIHDGVIDEIYLQDFCHHVDGRQFFPELIRVLKPNGKIHVLEPWPTIFRTMADLLTIHLLHHFSLTFRHRRTILLFEKEDYRRWLTEGPGLLEKLIASHGLRTVRRRKGLFDLYLTLEKHG